MSKDLPVNFRAAARAAGVSQDHSNAATSSRDDRLHGRLPLPKSRARASRLLPTNWPKVGGDSLSLSLTSAFMSEEWRDTFVPGENRIIYHTRTSISSGVAFSDD